MDGKVWLHLLDIVFKNTKMRLDNLTCNDYVIVLMNTNAALQCTDARPVTHFSTGQPHWNGN